MIILLFLLINSKKPPLYAGDDANGSMILQGADYGYYNLFHLA
jgi:hypothetical protein